MITKSFLIKILKRILMAAGILIVLCIFLGFLFYEDGKNWVLEEIDQYISEVQSGDLEIEEVELALFQHLPNITVQLSNIEYYEQKDSLRAKDQSPILFAEKIYLAFEPWELIKNKNLRVNTITIENGLADLLTYEDNKTNLEKALTNPHQRHKADKLDTLVIKEKKPNPGRASPDKKTPIIQKKQLAIQLKEMHLKNITLKYNNPSEQYSSQIELASLDGMILLNSKGISCDLETSFEITKSAKFPSITEQGPVSLSLNLDFIDATKRIVINKGNLSFENVLVDIKGTYDHKNGNYVDMEFDASSNDIAFLSKLVQEEILTRNKALINKADILLQGRVKGQMEDNIPEIDVNFGVKDLSMEGQAGKGKFNNVGFEGEFHTGKASNFSGAILSLRNLRGEIPGGSISGNFYLKNYQQPYLKSDVNVSLALDSYDDIFILSNIDSLQGKINFTSDFDGLLNLENEHEMDTIGSWSLEMENIGFKVLSTQKTVSGFNGKIEELGNKLFVKGLGLDYDGSNVILNGEISHFYHFLFNKEQNIEANMDISSSQFYTKHFVLNPDLRALIDERVSDLVLKVKATGRENDSIKSNLPWFTVDLEQLSFKLDTLADLPELRANIELYDTQKGLRIDLKRLHANMPIGSIDLSGNVVVMDSARLLDAHADMILDNIPESYLLDLIYKMKDLPMMSENERSRSENTLYNGDLHMSGTIETIPFAMQKAQIEQSTLTMRLPDSLIYEFKKVNLNLDSLYFLHEEGSNKIVGIKSVNGDLELDEVNTPILGKVPLNADFSADNDQIQVNFSTFRNRKMEDSGSLTLDISKESPAFEISYDLRDVPIKSFIEGYSQEKLAKGMLDASFSLEGSGLDLEEITKNAKGSLKVKGDSITLYGIDVDKLLKKYKRSQNFNLVDIGAFVVAGPVGAVVTKGGDFVRLISMNLKAEDTTYVSQVLTNWKIHNGIIETEDVAFNTPLNRFAFDGKFDIVNDSISGFTAYVLDKNGCSLMEQKVSGKLDNLQVGKLKIAKTLLGSVINFVNAIVGKKCKPVYHGEVQHPL
ncbi:MAG: AsmA-like C-terminal region-containing protein [Eudoraea sp.]|uniref:AsmA family protein n=1 Tax=Eudoraea sp. TaxID=1979955 RepID=UPI003C71C642